MFPVRKDANQNIYGLQRRKYYFMERHVRGKIPLFLIFAIFLLALCGTAGAALITPSTLSEYPTAFIQPYSGIGLAVPVPIGYTQNLPTYSDIQPLYTSAVPIYAPITTPGYKPIEIVSPVYAPALYPVIPVYSPVIPELKFSPYSGSYTPVTPVIPYVNPSSSYPALPDSEPDSPSSTVPTFSRPISSGTILLDTMFPRGLGELNIKNAKTDKDAVAILVRSGSLEPLIAVYINAEDKNTMKGIQDGTYTLYYSLGQDYDPVARQFTRNAEYYRLANVLSYATTSQTTRTQFKWSWTVADVTIGYGNSQPVAVGKNGFPVL
jgi:hypothetical protein